MTKLTPAELKLAAKLLSVAGDVFGNHVCNDFDMTFLPLEDRREILKAFEQWNNSPEDYDENRVDGFMDDALMDYMSYRLRSQLEG